MNQKNLIVFKLLALLLILIGSWACSDRQSSTVQNPENLESVSILEQSNIENTAHIPSYVIEVLKYVRKNKKAPNGYVGGRRFGNFEKRLPINSQIGQKMSYQEWDVMPKQKDKSRGAERLVTSQNQRAWYTKDHYESFVEIK